MSIEIIEAYAYKDEIKSLFTEYTKMLIEGESEFKKIFGTSELRPRNRKS